MPGHRSALVLVDNQRDFIHPDGLLGHLGLTGFSADSLARYVLDTNELLDLARGAGLPVVHVVTEISTSYADSALSRQWWERGFNAETGAVVADSWGAKILEGLDVHESDHVVVKKGHSAFQFTALDRLLRNLGVRRVVLAGGAVAGCLSDTTHLGASLGYHFQVVRETVYPLCDPYLDSLKADASLVGLDVFRSRGFLPYPAEVRPPRQSHCVLVIMDAQECFLSEKGHAAAHGVAAEDLTRVHTAMSCLLAAAREGGAPVIFISTVGAEDGSMLLAGPLRTTVSGLPLVGEPIDYADHIEPAPGEAQLLKYGPGAFTETPLDRLLRSYEPGEVLLAGGEATGIGSVGDTVRAGAGLGYDMVTVPETYWAKTNYLDRVLSNRGSLLTLDEARQRLRAG